MSLKQHTTYETEDGRIFTTLKSANRHAAELYVTKQFSYSPKQFDEIFNTAKECKLLHYTWASNVADWRDLYGLKNIKMEKAIQSIIDIYKRYTETAIILTDENGSVIQRLEGINLLKDGEEEKAINKLIATIDDDHIIDIDEKYRDKDENIILIAKQKPMTIHEKLEKEIKLNENELRDLTYGDEKSFAFEYEEKGDNRRWSRTVLTVVRDLENQNLWCIEWEEGLTEYQENGFWTQPYKVTIEKTPITIVKTTIKKIED